MNEPILLVPGMMSDARVFAPQIADLSRDYPLHVARVTKAETIREMAAETIHHAPPRFALAGHSMGGMVAMEILRRVPDRVTRIALISTTPLPETPEQAAWREPQIVKALAGNLHEAMRAALSPESIAAHARNDVLAITDAMAADLGAQAFIRQSRALQRRPDGQKTLRTARVPSLVLCGGQDKLTPPRRHEFMAELIPYAELAIIEEAGHVPMLETPDKVNLALRAWMDLPMVLR